MTFPRPIARIAGNFGISFLAPLGSINIGESLFNVKDSFTFDQQVLISFIAAAIAAGISISKEAIDYGNKTR